MGRNGKKAPVFLEMVKFVNDNVGKVVSSSEILLGKEPGRNSETAYLYKFVKLGYVEPVDNNSFVKDKTASFKVIKEFPKHYNSVMLMDELPENWTYPLIQPKLIEKYCLWKRNHYGENKAAENKNTSGIYH